MFLAAPISEGAKMNLYSQNKDVELIVDAGFIGTGNVWVYKVIDSIE